MKNENLKAIVGLVVAIALVVVMAYILKLTNNIQSGGGNSISIIYLMRYEVDSVLVSILTTFMFFVIIIDIKNYQYENYKNQ